MFPSFKQWRQWSLPSKLTAVGAYVGVIAVILTVILHFLSETTVERSTHDNYQISYGPQSPIINTQGDVNVTYGVSQTMVDRWRLALSEHNLSIEHQDKRIRELAAFLSEFKESLESRSKNDSISKRVLEEIKKENFTNAETFLVKDLDMRIQKNDFQTAVERATDLSVIKELETEPLQATSYSSLAEKLRKANNKSNRHDDEVESTVGNNQGRLSKRVATTPTTESFKTITSTDQELCDFPGDEALELLLQEKYEEVPVLITEPKMHSVVPFKTCIKGVTRNPDSNILVLVRPLDMSSWWWQPKVKVNEDGRWCGVMYIGSGPEDMRREFDVRIVTNPKIELNEEKLMGSHVDVLPKSQYVSEPIRVRRR